MQTGALIKLPNGLGVKSILRMRGKEFDKSDGTAAQHGVGDDEGLETDLPLRVEEAVAQAAEDGANGGVVVGGVTALAQEGEDLTDVGLGRRLQRAGGSGGDDLRGRRIGVFAGGEGWKKRESAAERGWLRNGLRRWRGGVRGEHGARGERTRLDVRSGGGGGGRRRRGDGSDLVDAVLLGDDGGRLRVGQGRGGRGQGRGHDDGGCDGGGGEEGGERLGGG